MCVFPYVILCWPTRVELFFEKSPCFVEQIKLTLPLRDFYTFLQFDDISVKSLFNNAKVQPLNPFQVVKMDANEENLYNKLFTWKVNLV